MSAAPTKCIWILRTWCNEDSFLENVREDKVYERAFSDVDSVLEEIKLIVVKEEQIWKHLGADNKEFIVDLPTTEHLKTRSFWKFLTMKNNASSQEEYIRAFYIERLYLTE